MMAFRKIAWRLIYLLFVLLGISLGTFALFALAPGDPAEIILRERSETPDREQIALLRQEMGLDDPWPLRYVLWMKKVCGGDWGESWRTGRPVWTEIAARTPATIELALASFFLVVIGSLFCGIFAALWRNRIPDYLIQAATVMISAMPSYWLGLLLIYFVSLKMNLLPVTGRGELSHVILPALTLALSVAVLQGRILRATLVQIISMDYIRFAISKGLGPWRIFIRHILPNALPPMATLWGLALGQLLGGAVIVETIFAWPGIGRLTVEAVMGRDIPLVQAIVLLMALIFVTINQLVEKMHQRLDPKVGIAQ